ncbi:hypothetical protein JVU11DRAFT_12944 [Chiua virens]|nr:hypothetical protein JVU11DRAFT_12944 [Chiua virens]
MQPTPAPSSRPGSFEPISEDNIYPAPPQNKGSAPFSVLAGLFAKLSTERKPGRRRHLLDVWFNVSCSLCLYPTDIQVDGFTRDVALEGHDLYPVIPGMFLKYISTRGVVQGYTERLWVCRVRFEGEEPRQGLHQAYPAQDERCRRDSTSELEMTFWEICLSLSL